jgi:hypothetical protein
MSFSMKKTRTVAGLGVVVGLLAASAAWYWLLIRLSVTQHPLSAQK